MANHRRSHHSKRSRAFVDKLENQDVEIYKGDFIRRINTIEMIVNAMMNQEKNVVMNV